MRVKFRYLLTAVSDTGISEGFPEVKSRNSFKILGDVAIVFEGCFTRGTD